MEKKKEHLRSGAKMKKNKVGKHPPEKIPILLTTSKNESSITLADRYYVKIYGCKKNNRYLMEQYVQIAKRQSQNRNKEMEEWVEGAPDW